MGSPIESGPTVEKSQTPFREQPEREKKPVMPATPAASTQPHAHPHKDLLPEEMFLRMLCLERKRAERAGRAFVLVVLEGERLFRQSRGAAGRVAEALAKSVRETDLVGWHRAGAAMGVLLTEIGNSEPATIRRTMLETITTNLREEMESAQAESLHISFHFFPEEREDHKGGGGGWADRKLYPDLERHRKSRKLPLVIKRVIDLTGSLGALIVLSPVLAVIAALIKLNSKGPVLFRQTRVGQHGVTFSCLKFRSMRMDSDPKVHREFVNEFIRGSSSGAKEPGEQSRVFKITDDPRVTQVGRVLRKLSLDELPQFWNVLVGDMSLVGPRPPIPYELESYKIWHRRRILEVKPGVTGLWQVYGRSRTTFDEMVRMDLRYARRWSLWLDLKILVMTPVALVSGEGAY